MAVASPEVSLSKTWFASMARLGDAGAGRVPKAVAQFLDDPDHPGLNLHRYHTVLDPPPADPSCAHPESTRPDWAVPPGG